MMQFLTRLDLLSQLPPQEVAEVIANLAGNASNDNSDEPTANVGYELWNL